MALVWHLAATTKSAAVLSLAVLLGFFVTALLGIPGGVVDRFPHRLVMVVSDLAIAAVSLVLAVMDILGQMSTALILVILAVRAVGSAFYQPAVAAFTPLFVPEDRLVQVNGWIQARQRFGYIVGAALAGVLSPIWTIGQMVLLDVAGAVIASICVLLVEVPAAVASRPHETSHVLGDIVEGWRGVRAVPAVFAFFLIGAV